MAHFPGVVYGKKEEQWFRKDPIPIFKNVMLIITEHRISSAMDTQAGSEPDQRAEVRVVRPSSTSRPNRTKGAGSRPKRSTEPKARHRQMGRQRF